MALIFLEDVGLNRTADLRQRLGLDEIVFFVGQQGADTIPRRATRIVRLQDLFFRDVEASLVDEKSPTLLPDGSVEEKGQHRWSRSVDRHRHGCGRVAEIETGVESFRFFDGKDRHSALADFPVDIGTPVWIFPV